MRYRRFRRITKPQFFGLLMVCSLVLMFLPRSPSLTGGNVTQLIALPQLAARVTTQKVADEIRGMTSEPVPAEKHAETLREKVALENEVASLRQQVLEQQSTINDLAHIRQRGFPNSGSLIPARVLAADAAAGRDSLLVGKGSMAKVKNGDWVASRLFVEAGHEDGVREQLAVLAHECLLGWVEQTSTLTSRVVLLSDPLTNKSARVRIVARDGKRPPLTAGGKYVDFSLSGDGRGMMKIRDIPRDYVDSGRIKVGDIVTSDPTDARLPMAMVVGKLEQLQRNKNKPVYYDAVVAPLYDPQNLSQVYIVDLSTPANQPASPAKPAATPSRHAQAK